MLDQAANAGCYRVVTFLNGLVERSQQQRDRTTSIYPLKITQISVKDQTETMFYVQAPHKMDLQGDFSYQVTWQPM